MCHEFMPDLVLMDMNMPTVDGVTATRVIRQAHPDIKVLALTGYMQDNVVKQALQAGAAGYLLKSVSLDELMSAIRSVVAGQIVLSSDAAEALVQVPREEHQSDYGLTEREQEVLQLMIDGLSNNVIAEHLHVSPMTVKSHVSSVLSKMNVATRAEAVALATRRGIVH
jgi:NarL family two-component system response regulator LiaR